ncbi:hypothetical protein D9M70_389960 [compost metagenome]
MRTQSMPQSLAVQALAVLVLPITPRYSASVAVNPAAGFGDPIRYRRTGAINSIAGAFFVPAMPCYGGRARETFGSAGFLYPRFANLRTAATLIRLATVRGSSSPDIGAPPMKHSHALTPSAIQQHAAALKARAFAALRADSSLSVRLARYNAAMARARALEVQGGAQ